MSSPIAARAAFRAASRVAGRRQFSVVQSLRSFARSFEPHPFERLPVTANAQAADWGRQIKRVGTQVVIFLPAMFTVLGWPYAARMLVDGKI